MPCGICKEIGHNSRTCSKKNDQIIPGIIAPIVTKIKEPIEKKHYCYILQQVEPKGNKSLNYVGYTVNYNRRLRQHNGIIKGGAFYTKGKNRGPWEFLAVLHCPSWNNIMALQHEWLIKHPERRRKVDKRFYGSLGKINSLIEVCKRIPYEEKIDIYVHPNFYDLAIGLALPDNIKILETLEF
jgi:predicted GIY-YIG superfamily endonuclease